MKKNRSKPNTVNMGKLFPALRDRSPLCGAGCHDFYSCSQDKSVMVIAPGPFAESIPQRGAQDFHSLAAGWFLLRPPKASPKALRYPNITYRDLTLGPR